MTQEHDILHHYQELTLPLSDVKLSLLVPNTTHISSSSKNTSRYSIHSHFYYELFYAIKDFSVIISNHDVQIKKGALIIVSPNIYHSARFVQDALWWAFPFHIKPANTKKVTSLYEDLIQTFSGSEYVMFDANDRISAIVETMKDYQSSQSPERNHLLAAKFYELIFTLKELKDSAAIPEDPMPALRDTPEFDIDSYIGRNYRDPDLSLEKLANKINLSTRQLNRIVKKKTSMTFRQYLITIRMQNAIHLLTESQLKVKDISEFIGYSSVHGFYAAFRKKFGCTPEEYRQMQTD